MKRYFSALILIFFALPARPQVLPEKLAAAVQLLEKDPVLRHGLVSLCVEDADGKSVYKHLSETGMAVASSQKVLTSIASFEMLGNDFRFSTRMMYTGTLTDGILNGNLIIQGSGDPSLGSWRWPETKPERVLAVMTGAVASAGIKQILGSVLIDSSGFESQSIPDGWIWQDIGNYYGAGAWKLNWKENQYDLQMRSGSTVGSEVKILNPKDSLTNKELFRNELRAAAKGTGDNAIIYLPVGDAKGIVSGTIPAGENRFIISGAMPQPANVFIYDLENALAAKGITVNHMVTAQNTTGAARQIGVYTSPSLDSLNYWFLKRSINLYGESFVKAIASSRSRTAGTNAGVEEVRNFWLGKGIEKSALRIMDGSGLSPQNRVTTQSLTTAMRYAASRPWFNSFFEALPLMNNLKMKSGSIGGARSFTGYVKKQGEIKYVFAIVVNNYDGSSAAIVQKLYAILDNLK